MPCAGFLLAASYPFPLFSVETDGIPRIIKFLLISLTKPGFDIFSRMWIMTALLLSPWKHLLLYIRFTQITRRVKRKADAERRKINNASKARAGTRKDPQVIRKTMAAKQRSACRSKNENQRMKKNKQRSVPTADIRKAARDRRSACRRTFCRRNEALRIPPAYRPHTASTPSTSDERICKTYKLKPSKSSRKTKVKIKETAL